MADRKPGEWQMACFTLALKQGEGRVRAMCVERKRRISYVEFMLVVEGLAKLLSSVSVPKNPFLCSKMLYFGVHEKLRKLHLSIVTDWLTYAFFENN